MSPRVYALMLTVLMGIVLAQPTRAQFACSASSPLSDDDARILLYVTPAAIDARKAGTDVDIEKSAPSAQYPTKNYFVAALVSQKPTEAGTLGNGILGYFAVNKRTGEVKSTVDFALVTGKELERIRAWLFHARCN
jgi:hypothetical protein